MADADPTWLTPVLAVASSFGAMIGGIIWGRKREAKGGDHGDEGGDARLVMGSFVSRQAITDLATTVANVDGTLRELVDLLQEARDEKLLEKKVREILDHEKGK